MHRETRQLRSGVGLWAGELPAGGGVGAQLLAQGLGESVHGFPDVFVEWDALTLGQVGQVAAGTVVVTHCSVGELAGRSHRSPAEGRNQKNVIWI